MTQRKKILVVGGTGVISYAVVMEAIRQGHDVTCINRGKHTSQKLPDNVHIITADYRDAEFIRTQLKGQRYDVVMDVLCFKKEDIDYSVNLFKDYCDQYIFVSSAEVYDKQKYVDEVCYENADLCNTLWKYSVNKVACEKRLKQLAEEYRLNYTIIRPGITYGNTRIPYGIVPPYGFHGTIIQRIIYQKPIITWNGSHTVAMFTRVEDFAVGCVGLMGNPKAYGETFNLCGDEAHSWKEVIDTLGVILQKTPIYFDVASELLAKEMPNQKERLLGGRNISQRLDNKKIKSVVAEFKTQIPLEEGIRMTVNYYQNNNYLLGIDYCFDGVWDRIINKQTQTSFRSGFIDYLGNATIWDRLNYYSGYYQSSLFGKVLNKLIRMIRRK